MVSITRGNFRYQHVTETLIFCASAYCCMSAFSKLVVETSGFWFAVGTVIISLILLVPLRFARMLAPATFGSVTDPPQERKKIMAVLGTGGHTSEMILLLNNLNRQHYARITYVYTSDFCRKTVHKAERARKDITAVNAPKFRWIPRSRKVKQGWLSTVFTTVASLPRSLWIVFTTAPDVLVVNGPGVCIPIAAAVIVLNIVVGKVSFFDIGLARA